MNQELTPELTKLIILTLIWVTPWKAVALWKSARSNQKGWFVALLIINTMAILEIVYIFFFSKKKEASNELPAKTE